MTGSYKEKPAPPIIGPFVFPTLLAAMGAWCFYDGWLSANSEMQEHLVFNRVASVVLLTWALVDFIRTRRSEREHNQKLSEEDDETGKDN